MSSARSFRLLETMLCRPGQGVVLVDRHLERLRSSAAELGFSVPADLPERIDAACGDGAAPLRMRLLLARDGTVEIEVEPLRTRPEPWPVALAAEPIDVDEPLLRHKTTWRRPYERARGARPGCDEVLLWNRRGELTEFTTGNLVLRVAGELVTPALESGLLPGTYRADLLARGEIEEAILDRDSLVEASEAFFVNSVRGAVRVVFSGRGSGRRRG